MPRVWIDTHISQTVALSTQTPLTLMTGVTVAQSRIQQMTLLRTIIGLNVGRFAHDSGEGSERASLGIGIASQDAFATVGALPAPQTNLDFPTRGWIWRAAYRIYGFAADQPAVYDQRIDLDIRSMRKLENGVPFINMVVEALEGTSAAAHVVGLIRQLWLVS